MASGSTTVTARGGWVHIRGITLRDTARVSVDGDSELDTESVIAELSSGLAVNGRLTVHKSAALLSPLTVRRHCPARTVS